MDTDKIMKTFETRKKVTGKALTDLYKIMNWITDNVDNVNVQNKEHKIHARISFFNSENRMVKYGTEPEEGFALYLQVVNGTCGLWYDSYGYGPDREASKGDIDYISLAEAIQALKALIEKLETIPTRESIGNEIARIAALI